MIDLAETLQETRDLGINSRLVAVFVWSVVCLGACMFSRDIRQALTRVVVAFSSPWLVTPITLYFAYIAAWAAMAAQIGVWERSLVADTVVWSLTVGLALITGSAALDFDRRWFHMRLFEAIAASAILAVVLNSVTFSLPIELVLIPVVTIVVCMQAMVESGPEYVDSRGPVTGLTSSVGVVLTALVAVTIAGNPAAVFSVDFLRALVLPMWLTIIALPFVFVIWLVSAVHRSFGLINRANQSRTWRTKAKFSLVREVGLRAREYSRLREIDVNRLQSELSIVSARTVFRDFRRGLAEERLWIKMQEERISDNAGAQGTDSEGFRLDRREYGETRDALLSAAIDIDGWMMDKGSIDERCFDYLGPFHELPDEHGINHEISADGKNWCLWRRTVTGWVFAIAGGTAPNEWLVFDGEEPPTKFPDKNQGWVSWFNTEGTNWDDPEPLSIDRSRIPEKLRC